MNKKERKGPPRPDIEKIRKAGKEAVKEWLQEKGYEDIREEQIDDMMEEITASRKGKKYVIGVTSSLYPVDPGFLSIEEKRSLLTNASSEKADVRLARVWLNEDLTLKDRYIMWSKLKQ